ncbi:MAG: hypothetical protein IPL32_08345 [Chloracidobacterium sp.]|nr:hypothetical protein [Chloracidobacterium sp.]
MGLAISVGILADEMENDPEGADWVREEIEQINLVLSERKLPAHVEPESFPSLTTRGTMGGFPYSFLHYLRRFYAHVTADSSQLPTPLIEGQDPIDDDPYYKQVLETDCDSHLLCHSDAEGYYLPIDFDEVIVDDRVSGEMLGSSVRLMEELVKIAPHLNIRLTDGYLSDETAEFLSNEEEDSTPFWIERLVWFELYENARLSIEHKTAIYFG